MYHLMEKRRRKEQVVDYSLDSNLPLVEEEEVEEGTYLLFHPLFHLSLIPLNHNHPNRRPNRKDLFSILEKRVRKDLRQW